MLVDSSAWVKSLYRHSARSCNSKKKYRLHYKVKLYLLKNSQAVRKVQPLFRVQGGSHDARSMEKTWMQVSFVHVKAKIQATLQLKWYLIINKQRYSLYATVKVVRSKVVATMVGPWQNFQFRWILCQFWFWDDVSHLNDLIEDSLHRQLRFFCRKFSYIESQVTLQAVQLHSSHLVLQFSYI